MRAGPGRELGHERASSPASVAWYAALAAAARSGAKRVGPGRVGARWFPLGIDVVRAFRGAGRDHVGRSGRGRDGGIQQPGGDAEHRLRQREAVRPSVGCVRRVVLQASTAWPRRIAARLPRSRRGGVRRRSSRVAAVVHLVHGREHEVAAREAELAACARARPRTARHRSRAPSRRRRARDAQLRVPRDFAASGRSSERSPVVAAVRLRWKK